MNLQDALDNKMELWSNVQATSALRHPKSGESMQCSLLAAEVNAFQECPERDLKNSTSDVVCFVGIYSLVLCPKAL